MRSVQNRLHLIWADRIVLWLAIVAVAALALCWCLVGVAAGVNGANHVVASFALDSGPIVLIALVSLWALLRAIDFIGGGATHRLVAPAPEPDAAPPPVHGAAASTGKPMAAA
jgi:hypothetical protein